MTAADRIAQALRRNPEVVVATGGRIYSGVPGTAKRWVGRGRLRLAAREYARRYLNVKRLPAGVPVIIDAWCNAQEKPDYSYPFGAPEFFGANRSLAAQLQHFRKPYRGL